MAKYLAQTSLSSFKLSKNLSMMKLFSIKLSTPELITSYSMQEEFAIRNSESKTWVLTNTLRILVSTK
jgi:hypothetical protein